MHIARTFFFVFDYFLFFFRIVAPTLICHSNAHAFLFTSLIFNTSWQLCLHNWHNQVTTSPMKSDRSCYGNEHSLTHTHAHASPILNSNRFWAHNYNITYLSWHNFYTQIFLLLLHGNMIHSHQIYVCV